MLTTEKFRLCKKNREYADFFCSKSFSAHCTTSMAWSYDSCNGIIEKVKVYIDKDVHE